MGERRRDVTRRDEVRNFRDEVRLEERRDEARRFEVLRLDFAPGKPIPVNGVSRDESPRSRSYCGRPGLITVSEDTPMFGTIALVRWYERAIFSEDGV
jgi:hypothetical protein